LVRQEHTTKEASRATLPSLSLLLASARADYGRSSPGIPTLKMARVLIVMLYTLLCAMLIQIYCSSSSGSSEDPSHLGGRSEEITSTYSSGSPDDGPIRTDTSDKDTVVGEDLSSFPEMGLNQQHPSLGADGNNNFQSTSRQGTSPSTSRDFNAQKSGELSLRVDGDEGTSTMILLLNGQLYTPSPLGRAHILLAGKSIVAIFRDEDFSWSNLVGLPVKTIDVNGSLVVPGLIDIHVHITGGGGEAGPASRTPEASLSELLDAGLTTVVGTLGTDCVSRRCESLKPLNFGHSSYDSCCQIFLQITRQNSQVIFNLKDSQFELIGEVLCGIVAPISTSMAMKNQPVKDGRKVSGLG
jgi:hypothetical protein